jgi:hypothetical protein
VEDLSGLPRIALTSTMASRAETFRQVFAAIHPQVDHTYVYLDGYAEVPKFLRDTDRVTVRRAEEHGNLHASSRFLALRELAEPNIVVSVDDDIAYPPDYVDVLAENLARYDGRAVVGVHGRNFLPPHRSYIDDAHCLHFATELDRPIYVHELGTATCAFVSSAFAPDPRPWRRNDMDDIVLAIEAQRRGVPRVAIAREEGWLEALEDNQPDSLWVRAKQDAAEQTWMMHALLALYAGAPPPPRRAKPSVGA